MVLEQKGHIHALSPNERTLVEETDAFMTASQQAGVQQSYEQRNWNADQEMNTREVARIGAEFAQVRQAAEQQQRLVKHQRQLRQVEEQQRAIQEEAQRQAIAAAQPHYDALWRLHSQQRAQEVIATHPAQKDGWTIILPSGAPTEASRNRSMMGFRRG